MLCGLKILTPFLRPLHLLFFLNKSGMPSSQDFGTLSYPRSCQYQETHLSASSVLRISLSDHQSCISGSHLQEFPLLQSFIPTEVYSLLLFHQLFIFLTLHVSISLFIQYLFIYWKITKIIPLYVLPAILPTLPSLYLPGETFSLQIFVISTSSVLQSFAQITASQGNLS